MTKQRYALRIGNGILGSVLIGCFLAGGLAGGYAAGLPSQSSEKPAPPQPTPPTAPFVLPGDPFAFHGKHNIMQEAHFGIVNGKITVGIPYRARRAGPGRFWSGAAPYWRPGNGPV
jgi:hypothetical protein